MSPADLPVLRRLLALAAGPARTLRGVEQEYERLQRLAAAPRDLEAEGLAVVAPLLASLDLEGGLATSLQGVEDLGVADVRGPAPPHPTLYGALGGDDARARPHGEAARQATSPRREPFFRQGKAAARVRPLVALGSDPRETDPRPTDTRAATPRAMGPRAPDPWATDTRTAHARPPDARATEARSAETRATDVRSAETRAADARSAGPRDVRAARTLGVPSPAPSSAAAGNRAHAGSRRADDATVPIGTPREGPRSTGPGATSLARLEGLLAQVEQASSAGSRRAALDEDHGRPTRLRAAGPEPLVHSTERPSSPLRRFARRATESGLGSVPGSDPRPVPGAPRFARPVARTVEHPLARRGSLGREDDERLAGDDNLAERVAELLRREVRRHGIEIDGGPA